MLKKEKRRTGFSYKRYMKKHFCVITPWHRREQLDWFLSQWGIASIPEWLLLQQDSNKEGCGVTKNRGIKRAMELGYEHVVVLDDDCAPSEWQGAPQTLEDLAGQHIAALQPQPVPMMDVTTTPIARGIPYFNRTITMPVAASIGYWSGMPDRDAARQLAEGVATGMDFERRVSYGKSTMLCGMNIAFKPHDWFPWCSLIEVSRLDDVFMSWLWSKEAARRGHCFNYAGPMISHKRQSHVFNSLIDEAKFLELNETLWSTIWQHPANDYEILRNLIPVKRVPV